MNIYHIKQPQFPEFRFEWHPQKNIVYLIRLGVEPESGEAFGLDIKTHGDAINATMIWLRGYKAAKAELPQKELIL